MSFKNYWKSRILAVLGVQRTNIGGNTTGAR